MKYPLENLDDERFQQLCQALLVRGNPGVQCFPIGQPDGGRDAVARDLSNSSGKFLVYQVKFVRDPARIENPREWLNGVVRSEIEKVRALVDRSATGYFLLTNVIGSGHLDVGSIDRLSAFLQEQLELPAICWWRDDIERRLDDAWSIKWAYPEIMSGPDFLRAILESGVHADVARREAVLQAFLRDQYAKDSEVRFRQVDLHNRLLDLFVDVPIGASRGLRPQAHSEFIRLAAEALASDRGDVPTQIDFSEYEWDPYVYQSEHGLVGAASFLLRPTEAFLRNVVLEGAPGQGKSTITQYLCQVHRIRLLKEIEDIRRIPKAHRDAPVRLPIRVDLRDFALWTREENPFTRGDRKQFPVPWQGQLEPFLAALISSHAGGQRFSVDDLIDVLTVSAVCLVLDGLDEIADIATRTAVVEELITGTQRLTQNSASLQVIVTSRPTAFLNSPGIPESKFAHLSLRSLSPRLINQYFELWAHARNVPLEIKSELQEFITAKLNQPHVRDLARNPMQLTILLSLLYTKGAALPEKRTALYDSYIDHFLDREAEKSTSVRIHRDVLIDLHSYLAWVMHSNAERRGGSGSLSQAELLSTVREYLVREGRDPSIANQLFEGMERVVVLVSRTEGAVEFEVQPIREYFAARYLFETAPLSSPGNERQGARPDRFEVIAHNFYWLNVARFFAGFYSKGEIASLVDSLRELSEDSKLHLTNHVGNLAAALLSDWVFAQLPRAVEEVVDLITDGPAFFRLLASHHRTVHVGNEGGTTLQFAEACGNRPLAEKCFALLSEPIGSDVRGVLLSTLRLNAESAPSVQQCWWERIRTATGREFDRWLYYGRATGILASLSSDAVRELPIEPKAAHVVELYRAGRTDLLLSDEAYFNEALTRILRCELEWSSTGDLRSPLTLLAWGLRPETFFYALRSRQPTSMRTAIRGGEIVDIVHSASPREHEKFVAFGTVLKKWIGQPVKEWASSLAPWHDIVECARESWGESRAAWLLATVAGGVRTRDRRRECHAELFDSQEKLCSRTRYARLRADDLDYWNRQFASATTKEFRLTVLVVLFAWAPLSVLVRLIDAVTSMLEALSDAQWYWFCGHLERMRVKCAARERDGGMLVDLLPSQVAWRAACAFAEIADETLSMQITDRYLSEVTGDHHVETLRLRLALRRPNFTRDTGALDLAGISRAYLNGGFPSIRDTRRFPAGSRGAQLPDDAVVQILRDPQRYPADLVQSAERRYRTSISASSPTVAEIAEAQGWFT